MPHRHGIGPFALATLLCAGNAVADEELTRIATELNERWEQVSAYSATMRVKVDVTQAGVRVGTDLTGPVTLQRLPDGKARFRSEVRGQIKGGPFNILTFPITAVTVSDGDFIYSESRFRDTVTVTKSRASAGEDSAPGGGAQRLASADARYELRLRSTGKLNGRRVYEVEGKPKPELLAKRPEVRRLLMYFDRETGIQLKLVLLNAEEIPLTEVTFTDVTLNPEVDAAEFDYRIPPGAEVVDKTTEESE